MVQPQPPSRHQGKANVVFCDGHVESPTLKFLFEDTSDAALARWNATICRTAKNYHRNYAAENSPAIHGWVHNREKLQVPKGTKEKFCRPCRDSKLNRTFYPAMNG